MDVGRCLPHVWGFMSEVCGDIGEDAAETRPLPGMQRDAGLSGRAEWMPPRATLLRDYIKPSSSARLTAARRLLTPSLP